MVLPVPFGTAEVRRTLEVDGVKDTLVGSLFQNVSLITLGTSLVVAFSSEALTVQIDLDTSTLGVESPSRSALQTDLGVPVPVSTAQIRGSLQVNLRQHTLSVGKKVKSLVAFNTDVLSVEGLTVVIELLADSLGVEGESFRAL